MINAFERVQNNFKRIDLEWIKELGRISKSDFTRQRKMYFEDLVRIILNKKGRTTTMEINDYYKKINKRDSRISKQAFSKQRKK